MNFSELIDVTWFNFTQMPAVVVSSNSLSGAYIKLSNSEHSLDVYASSNNDTEISSGDIVVVKYDNKTGERTYINNEFINAFSEINYTFTNYSSWFTPPYIDSYALPRILIAFTFTKVEYTSTFVITTDDAMLAINNPDEDIESVDLYCDGVFVANVK